MKTFFAVIASFLASIFTPVTPAAEYMAQAREMIAIARADKAAGYHCAARAALQSAMAYRAAYHAERFYSARAV